MPTYVYHCPNGHATDHMFVAFEDRETPKICGYCGCGEMAEYRISMPKVEIFEPMYCEPLDCDVSGKREWEQIKKGFGVQEKEDRAGIRLEEKSRHAQKIGPQKPRGISYSDTRRRLDNEKKLVKEIDQKVYGNTLLDGGSKT